jgi:dipeptidyl aminopeptidase/acylaminoacyl peptidase
LLLTLGCGGGGGEVEPGDSGDALAMADYLEARWPSRPAFSPDGRFVSFLWTDWQTQDLYVVPVVDGGLPVALTDSEDFLGGPTWNSSGDFGEWLPDGSGIVYGVDGDLFLVSVPGGETRRLTETEASEGSALVSPDGTHLAFTRDGALFLLDLGDGTETRVGEVGRVDLSRWSPDGEWIAGSVGDPVEVLAYSPPYSGPQLVFRRARGVQRDAAIVSTRTGEVRRLLASPEQESIVAWAPDGASVLVERTDIEVENRSLHRVDLRGEMLATLETHTDEKYLNSRDRVVAFSPRGDQVLYTSDEDGWNHVYLVSPDGGEARQVTSGEFEVSFPAFSPDGETIYFVSTEAGTEQRQIYSVPAAGGDRTRLTDLDGLNTTAVLSPDGERIAFVHADASRLPDLWVTTTTPGGGSTQLTDSMTDTLRAYDWQAPEIVTYPGHEDLPIKAQLFRPRDFDPSASYPAIVHVHQAAIYQEVFTGSGPHKDNVAWYGWNQRLADRGYVVFNVDFRGSYGYGRDFRTANYLDVGVGDAADVIQGVEYLRGLGYVDMDRLGVYGMSYGGHMVLTLTSKYPEVFAAGVNIAGVLDFGMEGGPWDVRNAWMYARLNSPEENPEAYFNASALNFLDDLQAPILTVHGTADVSVNFLQSIKLVDELLSRGKRFEFEVYPGERHFFSRRSSWTDAFGKMERFFDEYVRDRNR